MISTWGATGGLKPASPLSWFSYGEQGAWYDPSDLTTLFQNSAGTTPVTAVEQPVGLMLDKSKGLVLGDNFYSFAAIGSSTGSTIQQTGTGFTASGGTTETRAYLDMTTVIGASYVVSFTASPSLSFFVRNGTTGFGTILTSYLNQSSFSFIFSAVSTTTTLLFALGLAGTFTTYNISVKQLPGNHAFQATAGNRPTLSARVNLLTKTEDFSDAVWTKTNSTVTVSQFLTESATTSSHNVYQTASKAALGIAYTGKIELKPSTRSKAEVRISDVAGNGIRVPVDLSAGTIGTAATYGVGFTLTSASISAISSDGYYTITLSGTSNSATTIDIEAWLADSAGNVSYAGDGVSGLYVRKADLRPANSGANLPAYQRVSGPTDYDTTGFPLYLNCNGTSTAMATNSIDFSATDKMTVVAGVRKLSDAATGIFAELSADVNVNTGSFYITAPASPSLANYTYNSKGTTAANSVASGYTAPISNVLSGQSAISTPLSNLRVNGAQTATSSASQGTGNYGNYPLYLFARAGTSLWFNGYFYGLIVCGATRSTQQVQQVETYINLKEGGVY